MATLLVGLPPFCPKLRNMRPFLGMAGIKKRPFKTAFYPLTYLVGNIHGFITDLPINVKLGVRILLIITDRLSKGVILILLLLIFAPEVATAFIERYVLYHGFPKAIVSNKGI